MSNYTEKHDPRISGVDFEDFKDDYCPVCGGYMEWVDCVNSCDEGQFDMHELNPNEYEPGEVEDCQLCAGEGGYLQCIHIPHLTEQPAKEVDDDGSTLPF
jgi:hypothetical protein